MNVPVTPIAPGASFGLSNHAMTDEGIFMTFLRLVNIEIVKDFLDQIYSEQSAIEAGAPMPRTKLSLNNFTSYNLLNSSYYSTDMNPFMMNSNAAKSPTGLKSHLPPIRIACMDDQHESFSYYFDPKLENKMLSKEEFMLAKLKILQHKKERDQRRTRKKIQQIQLKSKWDKLDQQLQEQQAQIVSNIYLFILNNFSIETSKATREVRTY